jgi:hypothetical protein
MTTTPDYVLGAVRRYRNEGKTEFLTNLFENGIPLHKYPESRELMLDLINGRAIRKRGEKLLNPQREHITFTAVLWCAQLHGAGLPLYGDSSKIGKPYASEIAANLIGKNHEHFYARIWKKHCEEKEVLENIEFGKNNAPGILAALKVLSDT